MPEPTGTRARPKRAELFGNLLHALPASLVVLALSLGLWNLLGASYRMNLVERERGELGRQLSISGGLLSSAINRRQSLLTGLLAYAESHPAEADLRSNFSLYASGLKGTDPAIRVIQIFPPSGPLLLYPEAGNEAVRNLNLAALLADERPNIGIDLRRTIASRGITLSDPYVLRQGGLGILARQAIFRDGRFWGMATIALDIEALLGLVGIPSNSGFSGAALKDRSGTVFFGDGTAFGPDSVQAQVALPEGAWTLSVPFPPEANARIRSTLLPFWMLGSMLSLALAALAAALSLRQRDLAMAVRDRTRERDASVEEFSLLFNQTAEAVLAFDAEGLCSAANPGICALLGLGREELLGRDAREVLGLSPGSALPWETLPTEALVPASVHRLRRAGGEPVDLEFVWHRSAAGALQGLGRDVTERRRAEAKAAFAQFETRKQLDLAEQSRLALLGLAEDRELAVEQLRSALHEKEILLRELFHRTRNNMQVIMAILSFEEDALKDESAQELARRTSGRILSMSLVHKLLYDSQDLSRIDLRDYVLGLVDHFKQDEILPRDRVSVSVLAESVPVVVDIAVPFGLVCHELLSNAVRHAFPAERRGSIRVELGRASDGGIRLEVIDDGVGVESALDFQGTQTLGLRLVQVLVQEQLKGAVRGERAGDHGVAVQVRIPDAAVMKRV